MLFMLCFLTIIFSATTTECYDCTTTSKYIPPNSLEVWKSYFFNNENKNVCSSVYKFNKNIFMTNDKRDK